MPTVPIDIYKEFIAALAEVLTNSIGMRGVQFLMSQHFPRKEITIDSWGKVFIDETAPEVYAKKFAELFITHLKKNFGSQFTEHNLRLIYTYFHHKFGESGELAAVLNLLPEGYLEDERSAANHERPAGAASDSVMTRPDYQAAPQPISEPSPQAPSSYAPPPVTQPKIIPIPSSPARDTTPAPMPAPTYTPTPTATPEVSILNQQIDLLNAELADNARRIGELEQMNASLTAATPTSSYTDESVQNLVNEATASLALREQQLQGELAERDDRITALNEKIASLEQSAALAASQAGMASAAQFEPQLNAANEENRKLTETLAVKTEALGIAAAELAAVSAEFENLKKSRAKKKESVEPPAAPVETPEEIATRLRRNEFVRQLVHQLQGSLVLIERSGRELRDNLFGSGSQDGVSISAVQSILGSTEHIERLLRDSLTAVNIEEGKESYYFEQISIEDVLKEVAVALAPLAKKKSISVTYRPATVSTLVNGDREKLYMAFERMLDNAIKYTPEKGAIEFALAVEEGEVSVTLKDTGIGIPKDEQQRIFDKFFRARNAFSTAVSGSGLGLFLAKQIIAAHHGNIIIESEEGKGTEFIVILPSVAP